MSLLFHSVSVLAYCAMIAEQVCTMIGPFPSRAVLPEEGVQCLNRCSAFVKHLYRGRFQCSWDLIKRLVDAHFVKLHRWRQCEFPGQVMDESQTTQEEDRRLIIKMHTICTQELTFTPNRKDYENEPVCLKRHYPYPRADIPEAMLPVYSLLGAAGDGCLQCAMHLVHGRDVRFDSCSLHRNYTPLDWALWKGRSELVEYFERLMMRQDLQDDPDFVMVEAGGGFASS